MKGFNPKYKSFPDYILKITKQIWENKDVESIAQFYTDNIPVRSPFGITYGNKPVIDATYATLKEFPNRQLLGEDVIWNGNDDLELKTEESHRDVLANRAFQNMLVQRDTYLTDILEFYMRRHSESDDLDETITLLEQELSILADK